MKGHLTRFALAASLTAAIATPASAFDLFGLFSKDENTLEAMLETVPADTPIFAGGHADNRMGRFSDSMMMSYTESDLRELKTILESEGDIDSPAMSLFAWWLDDYMTHLSEGYQSFLDRYGIKEDGAALFYLDGAMPVIRFALEDEDAFRTVLSDAETGSGTEARTTEVDGVSVQLWRLTPPNEELSADLAVAVHEGVATVTLFNGQDTQDMMARRLGLADIDQSMADAGTWDALGETYGFDEKTRMFIDIAKVVESILQPENTAFGRDLSRLAPDVMADAGGSLDAACRAEIVDLARQAPRLVVGNEALEVSGDTLSQSVRMIWEINNSQVTGELQKLSGSLPDYAADGSDKLFALALGLDVNQLAPVVTALWTQFTNADFECQQLIDLQTQAQSTNPAMLGMASGMAQGVKGIGAALYSVDADPSSPVGITGSALISLSAESPETIAGMITTSVPGMAGLSIPSNGDAVQVPTPLPNPTVYAAIKGKHLVVYTGEQAKSAADTLASEPLNTRGVTSAAFNYQRFGKAALTALDAMPNTAGLNEFSPDGNCSDVYTSVIQLAQLPMELTYQDDYTDRGWEALIDVDVQAADSNKVTVESGTYRTETLDFDCSWFASGQETFNSDGTGAYTEQDGAGQCDLYRIEYEWEQEGDNLSQAVVREQSRDSCDAEWTDVEAESYECTVLGEADSGFYCLYSFDGEATLMRYTRN